MPDIHIPLATLEAGARAAHDKWRHDCAAADHGFIADVSEWRTWKELETWERQEWLDQTRAAFVAMVEAWPGIETEGVELHFSTARTAPVTTVKAYRLILPLPQENENE